MIGFRRFSQQRRNLRDFIPLITLLPKSQVLGKERDYFRGFIYTVFGWMEFRNDGKYKKENGVEN